MNKDQPESHVPVIVRMPEDLVSTNRLAVLEHAIQLLSDGTKHLVLDFSRTGSIDDMGLKALAELAWNTQQKDGSLRFYGIRGKYDDFSFRGTSPPPSELPKGRLDPWIAPEAEPEWKERERQITGYSEAWSRDSPLRLLEVRDDRGERRLEIH